MPTTPPTFVDATDLPASDLNLLSDGISELQAITPFGTDYVGVQVTRASNQSIPNSTATPVTFTAQVYDFGNAWTTGTDVVIPAGWVPAGATTIAARAVARVKFSNNATGVRHIELMRNGTPFGGAIAPGYSSDDTDVQAFDVDPLTEAADIFTLEVTQNSGGALNIEFAQLTIEYAGVTG
jgi:hypothetical protein